VGFGSNFLQILILIELIWGMTFLKEACKSYNITVNFIVSGQAAHWYFAKQTNNENDP